MYLQFHEKQHALNKTKQVKGNQIYIKLKFYLDFLPQISKYFWSLWLLLLLLFTYMDHQGYLFYFMNVQLKNSSALKKLLL